NFQKNLDLVRKVQEIARGKGCTPAQLALAWLLARGNDIVPIPGTKQRARLEENAQAVGIALRKSDLARIDAVAPKGVAAGARYAETGMRLLEGCTHPLTPPPERGDGEREGEIRESGLGPAVSAR